MTRTITVDWLVARDACPGQIELFRAAFGASAELTRANLVRAAEAGLMVDWLAPRVLSWWRRPGFRRRRDALTDASEERFRQLTASIYGPASVAATPAALHAANTTWLATHDSWSRERRVELAGLLADALRLPERGA